MAMKLRHTEIGLPAGETWLDGILAHHPEVPGLIVQLERGGAALRTSRGAFINDALKAAGFATFHVGLLSHDEEKRIPEQWHHVAALTSRAYAVLEWIAHQPALAKLPIGMIGRDTAAAAMIRVAAREDTPLKALVSRSGRPDFAGLEPLEALRVPIQFVVGELDEEGPGPNRMAHDRMTCERELVIIPGASHVFEELGTMEEATRHIVEWFQRWMPPNPPEAA
ncbi:MAG TPA: alpha/beta hydrolase [Rhodocyclaceae bacterium]|nr:alpha/beta hydrolase [Rhodocyclaceae bacterium]